MNVMPRAQNSNRKELTREERRERRLLRREKQRKDNIGRAAKMHAARLQMETYEHGKSAAGLKASTYADGPVQASDQNGKIAGQWRPDSRQAFLGSGPPAMVGGCRTAEQRDEFALLHARTG